MPASDREPRSAVSVAASGVTSATAPVRVEASAAAAVGGDASAMAPVRGKASVAAPRFVIVASGRGSNAEALMRAFTSGAIDGVLAGVIANVEGAGVLAHAERHRVPSRTILSKGLAREAHELLLLQALEAMQAEHLLLAGYMRVLSPWFLSRFSGRILNIHPSLLPEFPGLHAAERQWEAGRSVAGATVHFVDGGVDTGPILLQGSIDVRGDEGPDGLAMRILTEVEHVIYPRAVRLFVERLKETA